MALARLFEGPIGQRDETFHKADQQALCSLLSFMAGAFLGRIGDKIGPLRRTWLIGGTFLQALFTMTAALTIWKSGQGSIASDRGDPSWTGVLSFVCLAFMSASLGLQGIQGKRLNTQFGTTSMSPLPLPFFLRCFLSFSLALTPILTFLILPSRTHNNLGGSRGGPTAFPIPPSCEEQRP